MAWVAIDRGIKAVEELGFEADLARWRHERDALHRDVIGSSGRRFGSTP